MTKNIDFIVINLQYLSNIKIVSNGLTYLTIIVLRLTIVFPVDISEFLGGRV